METQKAMITIDFWNTLVRAETGGQARRDVRIKALRNVAENHDEQLSLDKFDKAKKHASKEFDKIWFNKQRTPTTAELVNTILTHLDLSASDDEKAYLVTEFEESLWDGPPQLADNAKQVIAELSTKYPLGLISDTMYSPGRVLRRYLENHGIIDYFSGFVFSDETGYSKPNPNAFSQLLEKSGSEARHSWHIGDLKATDIKGAKEAGMNAILYTEFSSHWDDDEVDIEPDHTCGNWTEIANILL